MTFVVANVTIDLGGHTLTGALTGVASLNGVAISPGANGAVVKNGTVTKFDIGVDVADNDANLSALTATENRIGVSFLLAQGGMLLTSQISGNANHGVLIDGSQNIRVVNNAITNNGIDGIWVVAGSNFFEGSSGNTIDFNSSGLNGYAGILVARTNELGNPLPTPASYTP